MTKPKANSNPATADAGNQNPATPEVQSDVQTDQGPGTNSPAQADPPGDQQVQDGAAAAQADLSVENVMAHFNPRITVAIPYVKSRTQGDELRFATASLQKNLRVPFNVVVIGDREDWFSDEIIHLPCECFSDNPQADMIEKLKMAIASEYVSEKFIWTSDNTYLVSPVTMADLEVLKVRGFLDPQDFSGTDRGNVVRTIDLMKPVLPELVPWDYATHTPVVFEKEQWVEIFEEFPDVMNGGYFLESLYFNLCYGDHIPVMLDWSKDPWLLPIKTKNPNKEAYDRLVKTKKFMTNSESAYSAFLVEQLMKLFPEKSRFEK